MNNRKNKQEMNIEPELRAMMDTVTSKGIQSICFFNNKGGVGKTTLVANLAAQLALNLKKRILVARIIKNIQIDDSRYRKNSRISG